MIPGDDTQGAGRGGSAYRAVRVDSLRRVRRRRQLITARASVPRGVHEDVGLALELKLRGVRLSL